MEGIDPYIETVGACHSLYRVVAWGLRVDVGIDPYIETIGACHWAGRVVSWVFIVRGWVFLSGAGGC